MTDPRNRPVKTSLFDREHPHYKWLALSNTTLGMLMATINASIVIISLPAIFEGIGLNPLEAGNVSYLLWMLMGYMLVSAVLVVTFGRLGDMYGRVRIYNLGFVVFSVASIALSLDPFSGGPGATWLILWRLVQGVGGAMLFANSTAILTDAFPAHRRGMALGVNQVAAIAGSFIGLIIGGLLAVIDRRAVFLVSVPIGIIGTIWSYVSLKEVGARNPGKLDWPGNITFALGLSALLTAITYGIQPYGDSTTGWTNPWVLGGIVGGILLLVAFVFIELPLHGYAYADTPLWAGIYMLPITIGFLIAGPISGTLSDRFGARLFATVGLLIVSVTFVLLLLIPVNFEYWQFAIITGLSGLGSGMFGAPNRSAIMNSVPASERGAASGMAGTVLNAGTSLSIGLFFSLLIAGLATSLPDAMKSGLTAHGVPADAAAQIAQLPPVGSVFAAFLGYNPIQTLLGPTGVLDHLPASDVAALTGNQFFPQLISEPFHDGLVIVFLAAAIMSLIGAIASLVRGRHYVHAATAPVPVVSSAS